MKKDLGCRLNVDKPGTGPILRCQILHTISEVKFQAILQDPAGPLYP